MQRDGHHPAALRRRFAVQHIELVAQLVAEVVLAVMVLDQDGGVVDVDRMRHRVQLAAAGVHRVGHVVVDPVAHIVQPRGAKQIQRRCRLGLGGREPAAHRLPRCTSQHRQRVVDLLFLVRHRKPRMVQVVHVLAVGNDLPISLYACLNQRRVALGDRCVDGDRGADAVRRERLHDAKYADPVAIVAQRVMAQVRVGRGHRARRLERYAFHIQRKPLQRWNDPQGDARCVGPEHRLALGQYRPVVERVVHPIAALGIGKLFGCKAHDASPTACAAAAKASK